MNFNYVPEQQDIIWINFQPSKKNEIGGGGIRQWF